MTPPDREQVAEALASSLHLEFGSPENIEKLGVLRSAAQAWLDQGDALVIQRDNNGEWPDWAKQIVNSRMVGNGAARILDALSDRSDTP